MEQGSSIVTSDNKRFFVNDTSINYAKFLNYNECLVYIENTQPFADTDGITHVARNIRSFVDSDILWHELQLITDANGDVFDTYNTIITPDSNIVSNRTAVYFENKQIYSFASIASYKSDTTIRSANYEAKNFIIGLMEANTSTQQLPAVTTIRENTNFIEYPLRASNFVIKNNLNNPLNNTSRSALGSGIYGIFANKNSNINEFLTDTKQTVYIVDCPNAYTSQDKEHGESITTASLNTNRYLDRIISAVRGSMRDNDVSMEYIKSLVRNNSIENLVVLWNIMLYRSKNIIMREQLENILIQYIYDYFSNNSLVDSLNGNIIQPLPINNILKNIGYDGIIGNDSYINGWGRGCVSYNYESAKIITGDTGFYSK